MLLIFFLFLFYVDIFMPLFYIFQIRQLAVEHLNFYVLLPPWPSVVTSQLESNFDCFDNSQLASYGVWFGFEVVLYVFNLYIPRHVWVQFMIRYINYF